jgi:hypothetical protein
MGASNISEIIIDEWAAPGCLFGVPPADGHAPERHS